MMENLSFLLCFLLILIVAPDLWGADRGEIQSGETRSGHLASPGYVDSWTINGQAGDRVVITTARVSGQIEPEIYLYPPE
jgi:hypothetical protein